MLEITLTRLPDFELGRLIDDLGDDFTVIIFSDPNTFQAYEPEFIDPVHMGLRRHVEQPVVIARKASTKDNRPLFEKYQFFTPGEYHIRPMPTP